MITDSNINALMAKAKTEQEREEIWGNYIEYRFLRQVEEQVEESYQSEELVEDDWDDESSYSIGWAGSLQ